MMLRFVGQSSNFNVFDYLILNSPLLTQISLAIIDYKLLSIISRSCLSLTKLCLQCPLSVFDNNISTLNNLKQLSVSSLDLIHETMNSNLITIFPQVTQLYLDHYFAHKFKHCKDHDLFLLDLLFPKLKNLKLSHDITQLSLKTLLLRPGKLNLTHLYLHSIKSNWTNLRELIKLKCFDLNCITMDSKYKSKPFSGSPLTELKDILPGINFQVGLFLGPFEYSIV